MDFKNRMEMAQALMEGRRFRKKDTRLIIEFDREHLDGCTGDSPFRYITAGGDNQPMTGIWDRYSSQWEEIVEWWERIPKDGVLCRVWNYQNTELYRAVVIDYERLPNNTDRFLDDRGNVWKHAEPLTAEEARALVAEDVDNG